MAHGTPVLEPVRRRGSHGRQQDDGVLVIRTVATPADTNPAGDIFGGWLMFHMDLAAGNMAGRVSQGRSATVSVGAMQFLRPEKVGDEVTIHATLAGVGRTSMTIHVDVWQRPRFETASEKATSAEFVFVALDQDGNPRTWYCRISRVSLFLKIAADLQDSELLCQTSLTRARLKLRTNFLSDHTPRGVKIRKQMQRTDQ